MWKTEFVYVIMSFIMMMEMEIESNVMKAAKFVLVLKYFHVLNAGMMGLNSLILMHVPLSVLLDILNKRIVVKERLVPHTGNSTQSKNHGQWTSLRFIEVEMHPMNQT